MYEKYKEFDYYPNEREVDSWLQGIYDDATRIKCKVEKLNTGFDESFCMPYAEGFSYLCFKPQGRTPFYGYWQPAPFGKAPLLVHTPGAGAEIIIHPDITMQGFTVLHINPLGYMTPTGVNSKIMPDRTVPQVIPETIRSGAKIGYREWLIDCVIAIEWAKKQENVFQDNLSFFGTSQGGFGALILGSLYHGKGIRCIAAEEPFAINFPLVKHQNLSVAYDMIFNTIDKMDDKQKGWYGAGMIDILSHTKRLDVPVMLTSGEKDFLCPPVTIEALFDELPNSKLYYHMKNQIHNFSKEFIQLATSWFQIYTGQ